MRIKPYMPESLEKELLRLGATFSNPTRIHIIEALTIGPKSVHELQNTVRKIQKNRGIKRRIQQPALSQHLKILRVNSMALSRHRNKEVVYTLNVKEIAGIFRRFLLRIQSRKSDWK